MATQTNQAPSVGATAYSVTLWGSHPDAGNDDCWTGDEFATLEEALACYRAVVAHPDDHQLARACGGAGAWEYVEIDGPDAYGVTANPNRKAVARHRRDLARDEREWRREIAMEAGMLGGCRAYNDVLGQEVC